MNLIWEGGCFFLGGGVVVGRRRSPKITERKVIAENFPFFKKKGGRELCHNLSSSSTSSSPHPDFF